jgi:MFS family permease
MSDDVSTSTTRGPAATKDPTTKVRRAAASGFAGSTLEYYDFAVYGNAAAIVLPQVFFPVESPAIALISSLATYAVGYVARPIGAVVLGNLGDRVGRKNVLVFAMTLMGISTFLVGILPTYAQVGILAPILLVLLRLIQGFAVAGELAGASAMIVEHAPDGKRGFYASFGVMGTQFGSILGALAFIPLDAMLSTEAFQTWGWRIPFLLSAIVVIAAMVIRSKVEESPVFREQASEGPRAKTPIVTVFKESHWTVLRVVLIGFAQVLGTTGLVFGAAYATQKPYGIGMAPSVYLWVPVAANVCAVLLIPLFGRLSDHIGRRPMMIFGPLIGGLLAFPYLLSVQNGHIVLTFLLAIVMVGIFFQVWNATFSSFVQELFPTNVRVSGFSISFNIGLVIAGFLPTIFAAIAPPERTAQVPMIIGLTTLGMCVVAAIAAWTCPETNTRTFDQDADAQEAHEVQEARTGE